MSGFELRTATPQDWPAIETLLSSAALPLDGARQHLDLFVVARRSNTVVGTAGLEIHGDAALLRSVAVVEPERGAGLGRALVDAVLASAARRGIAKVSLLTTTAPAYFERFGFHRQPRESAPAALQASAEFQGACPATAVFMTRAARGT